MIVSEGNGWNFIIQRNVIQFFSDGSPRFDQLLAQRIETAQSTSSYRRAHSRKRHLQVVEHNSTEISKTFERLKNDVVYSLTVFVKTAQPKYKWNGGDLFLTAA